MLIRHLEKLEAEGKPFSVENLHAVELSDDENLEFALGSQVFECAHVIQSSGFSIEELQAARHMEWLREREKRAKRVQKYLKMQTEKDF